MSTIQRTHYNCKFTKCKASTPPCRTCVGLSAWKLLVKRRKPKGAEPCRTANANLSESAAST